MNYKIYKRTLRFRFPAGTSRGVYNQRDVYYIVLTDGEKIGIGEAAPLYDLSADFNNDYEQNIHTICQDVCQTGFNYDKYRNFPSIVFAIECALKMIESGSFIIYNNDLTQKPNHTIAINGLVWMGNFEEMEQRLREKITQHYNCIKIKIGAIDFKKEVELISQIRQHFSPSEITIRLDANGGLGKRDEALEKLKLLSQFSVHSIEQPIRQKQQDDMAYLCAESPIAIGLDEELIGVNTYEEKEALLREIRPQFIILKPTLHGGLQGCEEWIGLARKYGIRYWLTSALESNLGLNFIAQFAGNYPEITIPQGLGTGQLYETNLPIPINITGGRLSLDTKNFPTVEHIINCIEQL